MNSLQNESKKQSGLWSFLKKALWRLSCADWTPKEPNQPKTPQDCRDELLNKCPWKDFW
jgi:hypothetical protein